MIKRLFTSFVIASALLISAPAKSEDAPKEIVYYGFDPDIVTNYVSTNRRTLGFIRVSVELMVEDKSYLPAIAHHEPLILDLIISTLTKQPEEKVKSLTGREEIRLMILDQLQQAMKKESGEMMIKDMLFTKYLYQ